jgi:heme exporter protein CcmD
MSGHSFYVIAAYAVSALLLATEVWILVRRSRALARRSKQELRE